MALSAEVWMRGGIVVRVQVKGHAGFGTRGADPVCAAVTALVRTAARELAASPAVRVAGTASNEGLIAFQVTGWEPERLGWLSGVSALLVRGLRDLADEAGFQLVEHEE